jgi:hypothetical protein
MNRTSHEFDFSNIDVRILDIVRVASGIRRRVEVFVLGCSGILVRVNIPPEISPFRIRVVDIVIVRRRPHDIESSAVSRTDTVAQFNPQFIRVENGAYCFSSDANSQSASPKTNEERCHAALIAEAGEHQFREKRRRRTERRPKQRRFWRYVRRELLRRPLGGSGRRVIHAITTESIRVLIPRPQTAAGCERPDPIRRRRSARAKDTPRLGRPRRTRS